MKNTIISSNKNHDDDEKSIVGDKIQYFQQLIQKSVLSIQNYKQQDVISANELNQGVQSLERLYLELTKIKLLLNSKTKISMVNEQLETIRNELVNVFKLSRNVLKTLEGGLLSSFSPIL